jgi:hypothetical protein
MMDAVEITLLSCLVFVVAAMMGFFLGVRADRKLGKLGGKDEIKTVEYGEVSVLWSDLRLKRPIPVTVTEWGEEYVISWVEAVLYGSGETYAQAMAMFQRQVALAIRDVALREEKNDKHFVQVIQAYAEPPAPEETT